MLVGAPLWALIAAGLYMALPDLLHLAESIYRGRWVWNWYNKVHRGGFWFYAFYPHTKPDQYLHANMGGEDWWKPPPEGRLQYEVISWVILIIIYAVGSV